MPNPLPLASLLQSAVLNLFSSRKYCFPNLVGAVTRNSVKEVLLNGIFADQVWLLGLRALGERQMISYLITHAHLCMGNNVSQCIRFILLALNLMAFEKILYYQYKTRFGFESEKNQHITRRSFFLLREICHHD